MEKYRHGWMLVNSPFAYSFNGFCFALPGPKRKSEVFSFGIAPGQIVKPPEPEAAVFEQSMKGSWSICCT